MLHKSEVSYRYYSVNFSNGEYGREFNYQMARSVAASNDVLSFA